MSALVAPDGSPLSVADAFSIRDHAIATITCGLTRQKEHQQCVTSQKAESLSDSPIASCCKRAVPRRSTEQSSPTDTLA